MVARRDTVLLRDTPGAQTWGAAVAVDTTEACPCCRIALASAADGRVFASWRTVLPGDVRDIVLVTVV